MKNKKICLFTAHSPQGGGGSVILKSLIENLPEMSFTWYYIGNNIVKGYEDGYLGKSLMGGAPIKDIFQTWKMLHDSKLSAIDHLVDKLIAIECDQYWIISHNEGLRVALGLVRRQTRPVHLTIHDDWAGALCARSIRYRFMSATAKKLTVLTLKEVSSFDVISSGMSGYYHQLSGLNGTVCHRYLPGKNKYINNNGDEKNEVTVGHIGSIYDKNDFIAFLALFVDYVIGAGKKPLMKMWGCHLNINDIPSNLKNYIIFFPTLSEEAVIPLLACCSFVYAMYPLGKALSVFAKTSLPTKLTSYVQAGRPVFGHGPKDSTLNEFITSTDLGVIWTSLNKSDGFKLLDQILSFNLSAEKIENARLLYFGEKNLQVMRQFFLSDN